MSEFNQDGSVYAGSPLIGGPTNPNDFSGTGQPLTGETVPKAEYDKLYEAYGKQSNEVGEFRSFFDDVTPLLEKMDKYPEIAKAVMDEKFDSTLATAILEGKVSVGDAKAIEAAATAVQKDLGKKEFAATSAEDVAKLVEKEMVKARKELEEQEELRSFKQSTADFIANTPDFADHGAAISEWLDDHVEVSDVEVAYYAVKGQLSTQDAMSQAARAQAEASKDWAQNAGGGQGVATHIQRGTPLIDQLIGSRSNPNVF